MRTLQLLLLIVACVLAEDSESRRKKLPYIADAVGNTLPPPSNGPATVGSPVNLLTPDRYEFYTFDESGELVKRLMTLEEIQAIVAAGEEGEGLVTFANDNQPTIAFNFSQPPYTKVHSVVTNVQNVLKAQMEAHKNKPLVQPTLDTPDVSDSWSLILPSIFGNTGVDITPEKTSATFTTPETELKEIEQPLENSLSKEGSNQIINSPTSSQDSPITEKMSTTVESKPSSSTTKTSTTTKTTTTSTTRKPTTTQKPLTTRRIITTLKPSTVRAKPSTTTTTTTQPSTIFSTTTVRPSTTISTSTRPRFTTTTRPRTTSTTTAKPRTTTRTTTTTPKPSSTTPTTFKQRITTAASPTTKPLVRTTPIVRTTQTVPKTTTVKPYFTTRKRPIITTQKYNEDNFTRIQIQTVAYPSATSTTEENTIKYEKISTFVPISTATYVTEGTTKRPIPSPTTFFSSTTRRSISSTLPSTIIKMEPSITTSTSPPSTSSVLPTMATTEDKINVTTITTQSVSPSTTVTSTEFVSTKKNEVSNKLDETVKQNNNDVQQSQPDLPLFDVAQSISQIASDLGNYRPLPTSNDLLLDTTRLTEMNLESKENVEMEIPPDSEKVNEPNNTNLVTEKVQENFVKISTIDPQSDKVAETKDSVILSENDIPLRTTQRIETTSETPTTSTLDTFLSESMGDLLSQVVYQAPQTIIENATLFERDETTTDKNVETTTDQSNLSTVSESIKQSTVLETIKDFDISTELPATLNTAIIERFETLKDSVSTKFPITSITDSTEKLETRVTETNTDVKSTSTLKSVVEESTNQVSTRPDENVNINENYVQISISKDKDNTKNLTIQTTTTDVPKKESTSDTKVNESKFSEKKDMNTSEKLDLREEIKPVTVKDNQVHNEKVVTTTESALISSTTEGKLIEERNNNHTTQAPLNKIISSDSNKVEDINNKDKVINLPKIEDFKKKIQKVNIDEKELVNERNNSWKLISTVAPPKTTEAQKDKVKVDQTNNNKDIDLQFSKENQGLEITTKDLDEDVAQFTELCNELAFRYWHALTQNIDKKRSFVLSPYSITSMLSMIFMGARGATSGEMNEILKLDDMVTFNPHFTLKNISDSLEMSPVSGVLVSAFVRELFSDRNKGKILTFYKERASHFYNGHVEEVNFNLISDIIRRRTNLLIKRYTWGKIMEYMKGNTISMQPPFAAFSVNVFQTDCSETSVEGRDGEMYFVVSPNVRQRRLVPVPAVVYKDAFLAGYDPVLDATAAAVGGNMVSILFVMPGQQGNIVHAEDLEALEKRLLESNPTTSAWKRLLRTLLPRMGLELQIPRFSHKSIFNVSSTLKQMGLNELFDAEHADLGGVIGPSKDLYLSDMIQSTMFVTCGGGVIGEQHHVEEYPESLNEVQRRRQARWATIWEEPRDYQRAFHDPHDVGEAMNLPLHLRPRQARVPARAAQPARLKFDRPFLYFVRHNPTGMILYVGRYNPRLLP